LGKTTEEALQQGGLTGMVAELLYYQQKLTEEFGSLVTLMTGGDAPFLAEKMKSRIFVRPHLVLRGLNQILRYNNEEGSE
jgi:type III pantothenate kinase